MLIEILISTMLLAVMPQAQSQSAIVPYLVLPTYPALSARAGIEADFTVSLEIEAGQASKVDIAERGTWSPYSGKKLEGCSEFCNEMKQSIASALSHWQFRSIQQGSFSLTVAFRHKSLRGEEESQTYTVYKVRGDGTLPPSEILIELHFKFPDAR